MRTAAKSTIFVASLALAVGALTGCSGGQSVEEACKIVKEEVNALSTKTQESMSGLASDPKAAVESLQKMQEDFAKVGDKVSNTEVKDAYTKFTDAFGKMTGALDADVDFTDPTKAQEVMTTMTDGMAEISKAGEGIVEVCP